MAPPSAGFIWITAPVTPLSSLVRWIQVFWCCGCVRNTVSNMARVFLWHADPPSAPQGMVGTIACGEPWMTHHASPLFSTVNRTTAVHGLLGLHYLAGLQYLLVMERLDNRVTSPLDFT